jgi:hypothetical protein
VYLENNIFIIQLFLITSVWITVQTVLEGFSEGVSSSRFGNFMSSKFDARR